MNGPRPPKEQVRLQLDRILASLDFDASPRSRDFLRYVVECALGGNGERISQRTIARAVFHRDDAFDPSVDPIVRIQAGRLRRSLERYYLLEGVDDPVTIGIPKGTYLPVFRSTVSVTRTALYQPWPVVLVHALVNDTGDASREYLARGLTSELAVELSRYQDLRIVPVAPDVSANATTRSARFEVRGSVRREGAETIVTVALTDREDGAQLWGERYPLGSNDTDLAGFERKTAEVIAARLADEHGIVNLALAQEALHTPPASFTVHDAILRSYHAEAVDSPVVFADALAALEKAVKSEPHCGLALAQLARLHGSHYACGAPQDDVAPEERLARALHLAVQAVRVEPQSQRVRSIYAWLHLLADDLPAGRREAEIALELNGGSLCLLDALGYVLTLLGDWERGTALTRKAIRLNPCHRNTAHYALWLDAFRRGAYEGALEEAQQCRVSADLWAPLAQAATLGLLGRIPEAEAKARILTGHRPDIVDRGRWLITRFVKFDELVERLVSGLARGGLILAETENTAWPPPIPLDTR